MDTNPNQDAATKKPLIRKLWLVMLLVAGCLTLVLGVAALFIPHVVRGRNMRRAANEASAVEDLRRLTELQEQYRSANPTKGFTCELAKLRTETPPKGGHDPDKFLETEPSWGYTIALSGCEADASGVVNRYRATAVPLVPGKTGDRAFCTDQGGPIWYDEDGSAESCLVSHQHSLAP